MVRNRTLTKNQARVYEFVKLQLAKLGKAPTLSEIATELGVSSLRSVTQYLEALQRKGLIRRNKYAQRGIELIEDRSGTDEIVQVPVFASAGCGSPSIIAERKFDEYIPVSKSLIADRENVYVIRAVGESMIEAGIQDGDFVLTEMTSNVANGDLVVAIIDDTAVIKKITFANNAILLYSISNDPAFQPIILKRDFQVFGKVIQVIKVERGDDYQLIYEQEKYPYRPL